MAHKIFLFNFLILTLLLTSCNTTEPPPPEKTITITLEDVSCIEAWIKLTTNNLQLPDTVTLKQNNIIRSTINLVNADTLLYIDSLLPGTNYSYVAEMEEVISETLEIRTMDTTSRNFAWQTWTFGEHSSSVLYDVAILDENNIWAVGEIYLNDSLGQPDPHAYNAVHWDGIKWNLKKITVEFRGNTITPPLEGVFAFSSTDIWFVGSLPIHSNGESWIMYDLRNTVDPNLSLSKVWGSTASDIYFIGRSGSIAHYSGLSGDWQKIESGTETRINDIWGITSDEDNTIVYCPVSSFFVPGDKRILKIVNGKIDSVSWNRDIRLYSAWTVNENFLYVCGEGVFENRFGVWNEINLYPVGTNSIRGNGNNDIFIVGDYGTIFHFNGIRWQMLSTPNSKGYSKVAIKNNVVPICGNFQGQGLIEIGTRN